jgi:hypothetical protein
MDAEEHEQKRSQPRIKSPIRVLNPYIPILVPPSTVATKPSKQVPVPTPYAPEGPSAIGRIRGALILFSAGIGVLTGLGGSQHIPDQPTTVQTQPTPETTQTQPTLGTTQYIHTGWAWIQRSGKSWLRVQQYAIVEPAQVQNTLRSSQYTQVDNQVITEPTSIVDITPNSNEEWKTIAQSLPRVPPPEVPDSLISPMNPPGPVQTRYDNQDSTVSKILGWVGGAIGAKVIDAMWDSTLKKPAEKYLKKLKGYLSKRLGS